VEIGLHLPEEAARAASGVPSPAVRALRWSWRPGVADAAVALALALAGQLELWVSGDGTPFRAAVALVGTLPLAFRRRFPLGSLLGVMSAVVVMTAVGTDYFTFAGLLGMMLATYSVARYADLPRAVAGLVVADGAAVADSVVVATRPELGDIVFPLVLLSGPWLAGRALRLWQRRTAELQALTAELAAEREERAALAVAAERARIARELHDVLTSTVNVMVISAEAAEEALDHDPARVRAPLRTIQDTGREALRETRRMLGVLHATDGSLQPPPSTADVENLVELARSTGLAVSLRVEGEPRRLPTALELSVYRIVQQALTNTLTHAAARRAEVLLRYGPERLEIEVTDDGSGGDSGSGGTGHGIPGMRERAAVFGGSLTAGPAADGGFVVSARLPIERVPA
jgi:signal transduction histidine kinase